MFRGLSKCMQTSKIEIVGLIFVSYKVKVLKFWKEVLEEVQEEPDCLVALRRYTALRTIWSTSLK